ncbi:MAG: two component transcriptional regulator, winged helix family [Firmicutes bacterium]|nr:two component transcriptional regulator, winged helix family [Bacillota bacterium]
MHILLAEDDRRLGNLVHKLLLKQGMQVDWVVDGEEALHYILNNSYEVIILDWMMPEKSGLEICQQLRLSQYQGGILMFTAKDAVDDLVQGLEAGADDYLVKPFEFKELLARIRSVARRSKVTLKDDIIKAAGLELNRLSKSAKRGTRELNLTSREFQLLEILADNCGRVLPREVLLDQVWGWDNAISPNNLDAFIRLLRKKVTQPGEPELIHNIRGVGYKLEERDAIQNS